MPSVPTYDAPTVEQRPLGNPDTRSVASPELLGAGAQQNIELGKGMMAAGTGLAAVAYQMKQRETADALFRAETQIKDEYIKQEQDWRQNRQGRFAKDLTRDAEDWWTKKTQETGQLLKDNPDAQRLFTQRAARYRQQSISSVSQWEVAQSQKSEDESYRATQNSTIGMASANPSPEAVATARAELQQKVIAHGGLRGWTAEMVKAETMQQTTTLHKNVIQQLAQTDPTAAAVYFAANKSEIAGDLHAEIGDFAKKVTANAIGEASAGQVWEAMGPKNDRTPVELDKMEKALRDQLKGNEPALDSAIKRLRERAGAHKDARKERDEGLEAEVNKMILGGAPRSAIARSAAFNQLSPETARKIDSFLESRDYTRVARGAAEASRAESEERRKLMRLTRDGLDTALRLADPDVLNGLTRDQVVNLLPKLGPEHTTNLVNRWDAFHKNPEKLTEARIDKQDFDTIALSAGLRPNDKGKDEKEKDELVRLQSAVENAIGVEQRVKGKTLSREEKQVIMKRVLDDKVIIDKTMWFDQPKPLSMLAPDQLASAYVKVGDEEVKLTSIPAEYRADAMKRLRARGLGNSEQLIANMWVKDRSAWKRTTAPGASAAY